MADPSGLPLGSPVWTVGNAAGTLLIDGHAACSAGRITGSYTIAPDAPPARGAFGRELSRVSGPVFETDAAINDGSEGGAVLDDAGRLIGLATRNQVRARRLPTVVPIPRLLNGLGRTTSLPRATGDEHWIRRCATALAAGACVYLERPRGPGNPPGAPRPTLLPAAAPLAERERLQGWWDVYYHQQQIFFSDHPVPALAVSETDLLTSASNLHGGARSGRVLGVTAVTCQVLAIDAPLDLALLRCSAPHGLPVAAWYEPRLAIGDEVAVIGRHDADAGATLAIGMVSAATRIRDQSRIAFVQIDARVNYGSLGGPVVAADGRVAGLTVLMGPYPDQPWLINAGVTLVADAASIQAVLPDLRAGTSRARAPMLGLGVQLEPLRDRLAVRAVVPGTGAADAGIQPGDRILRCAGTRVSSLQGLGRVLLRHHPGDRIAVEIERDGATRTIEVEAREFAP
jgi:S1-C subfamily serine protease